VFRDLFESQDPDVTQGLVIGPAAGRPPRMHAVSRHEAPLWHRLACYWRVANRLARQSDVIDAHFALYAAALTVAGEARRRPWVVHFHGPWAAETVVQGDESRWRYVVRRTIERRVYTRAERILVLTSAFRQELISRYRVQPWKVEVVPPGVDLDRFSPGDRRAARAALAVNADAFLVVCTRRLVPRMGIEHLLEAWNGALDRGFPEDARLLIAGEGPLREQLTTRIDELGLSPSVELLGRISDEDLVALYRGADVNVVPTIEQEGFGLIVLEAAACGTPSIVTSVGGLPEAVGPLDRSLIVPPRNAGALAERIIEAQRGALPKRDATRAYAEQFSWPEMAARREMIYREVADGAKRDARLRVVYLDHVAKLSGGELALHRLLPHLHEVNAHVILFEDGPLAGRLRESGISVEIVPLDNRVGDMRKEEVIPGGASPRSAWAIAVHVVKLTRRLRQLDPDLVHTNSLKAGVIGSLAARLARIPVVWHLRDRLAEDYLPAPTVAATRWWIRRFATRVIANSSHTADTLSGGRSARLRVFTTVVPEVVIVPTAITSFKAMPREERQEFTVGMVGRLAPWKGQDIFLRAFASAFPDGAERAVIVGSAMFGEDVFAAGLPVLAEELGIADRVEWRGFVEDIPRELARFDVLVHASRVAEPFGQVVLEAFAAGIAIVAADDGGPSEIIRNEHDGLLCPPGDVASFAAALTRLREDSNFRARIAAAGHERSKEFSPSAVVPRTMEVYRAAVDSRE
jgi:glycosyltransferase involved in cell wall biosynthesis